MSQPFLIPKKRLQKPIILRGKTLLDTIPDYIDVLKHAADTKVKMSECGVPSASALGAAEAIKQMNTANTVLRAVTKMDINRQKILLKNIHDLDLKKKELTRDVEIIERNYLTNLKFRENDRLEMLTKVNGYIDSTRQIKTEKEKQDILIRIGLIVESLLEDLAPYEEILGRLSLQENAFKSKADTLASKKNILMARMHSLNKELKKDLLQCEDVKKLLFRTSYLLREHTHYNMNLINRLTEKDTRSMRAVLDLEYKLANLRRKAYQVRAENSWLYWFLDWVLFDVLGAEMLTGVSPSSSIGDKTQCIIESYKNVRIMLAQRGAASDPTIVDNVFN